MINTHIHIHLHIHASEIFYYTDEVVKGSKGFAHEVDIGSSSLVFIMTAK